MNWDVTMTVAGRLSAARADLRLTQAEIAARSGVSLRAYNSYENGKRFPAEELLSWLAQQGYNVNWLLTGQGSMRGEDTVPQPQAKTDPETLGRLWEGVTAVYREENQRIAPKDQARVVAELYDQLIVITDEAERRGALRFALDRLRRDLREAARDPANSKPLA